ncbi:DUF3842 family protein [Phosphitispora fastidiosa]|uniref:DUF3842 family protein n=1 Tax=Phosphitispora fastidiosa TaxID=2837202 RepID=UPI001E46D4F4|nr:DUF3842 family protein [Phosphitispora fastidiosa]MBU7005238.1 hypothetical protein [Phosphitispora fastidiosa]
MKIAVIDGQGGGIGKYIIERFRKEFPEEIEIIAFGTNALAAAAMLRAGANEGASGENAIIYNSGRVDLIVGPIGIIIANSFLGEVTPGIAAALASSSAPKILLPVIRDRIEIAGFNPEPLPHLTDDLMDRVRRYLPPGMINPG